MLADERFSELGAEACDVIIAPEKLLDMAFSSVFARKTAANHRCEDTGAAL